MSSTVPVTNVSSRWSVGKGGEGLWSFMSIYRGEEPADSPGRIVCSGASLNAVQEPV
jgi:hypothetical protein